MERTCNTCKYAKTKVWEDPCRTCMVESMDHEKWEPIETNEQNRHEIKLVRRPEILPKPVPVYERTDSEIPERVRISFTNGTSAIYDLHTDLPHPLVLKNIEIMKETKKKITQGYVNQPMRRRRRNRT